jgi:hypothetical protein
MDETTTKQVATNAMLVSLTISVWSGHRKDDTANQTVTAAYHLEDPKVARVWKTLLPDSAAYRKVRETAWALRSFHYANTLPYMYAGPRILPSASYARYMKGFGQLQRAFDLAASELVAEYPALREQAKRRLKDLYKEADYPETEKLRGCFKASVSVAPLPVGADFFRVQVDDLERERLKRAAEEELRRTYEAAMQDVWARLYDGIRRMHSALTKTTHPRRGETFDAVRELVDVLPQLNITGDETLAKLHRQFADSVSAYTRAELMSDTKVRAEAAAKTQALMDTMSAILGTQPAAPKMEMRRAA